MKNDSSRKKVESEWRTAPSDKYITFEDGDEHQVQWVYLIIQTRPLEETSASTALSVGS
jgi:hypothetical protein